MLRKMKTDEQNTPLNEMLICSICLTTERMREAPHVISMATESFLWMIENEKIPD